jgi:glycosyltransferase involved in cell wall biosynthesis
MKSSRISIVTISYNQAAFLEECIRSVIDQDASDVEYIVVDPGSTDGSREIIDRYRDRIDCVVLEPDAGPADGLNKGFARATGDIFGYINADDRYLPGALRYVQRYFASESSVDVLTGAIRIIDGEGRPSPRKRTADRFDPTRYAAGLCMIGQQATFFRREAFFKAGGFNRANRVAWDGELLVDMALAGTRFEPVAKVLGDWRLYGANITGSADFQKNLKLYFSQMKNKLAARSVPVYSPVQERIASVLYKFNVARHLRYLTVSL